MIRFQSKNDQFEFLWSRIKIVETKTSNWALSYLVPGHFLERDAYKFHHTLLEHDNYKELIHRILQSVTNSILQSANIKNTFWSYR